MYFLLTLWMHTVGKKLPTRAIDRICYRIQRVIASAAKPISKISRCSIKIISQIPDISAFNIDNTSRGYYGYRSYNSDWAIHPNCACVVRLILLPYYIRLWVWSASAWHWHVAPDRHIIIINGSSCSQRIWRIESM